MKEIFLDQNLYYYTFSMIVQAFLALVAFLGAVVIYKLQTIENALTNTSELAIRTINSAIGADKTVSSLEDTLTQCKNTLVEFGNKLPRKQSIEQRLKKLESLIKERENSGIQLIKFSKISFMNVAIALFGLPFSKWIVVREWYSIGLVYLVINISVSFVSMFFAFNIIRLVAKNQSC